MGNLRGKLTWCRRLTETQIPPPLLSTRRAAPDNSPTEPMLGLLSTGSVYGGSSTIYRARNMQ